MSDIVSGVLWILAVLSQNWLVTTVLFGCAWIPIGASQVICKSALQTKVDSEYLGRVMSFTTSISIALMPVGSLVGGFLGDRLGSETTILLLGPVFLTVAAGWLTSSRLRNLPKAMGIDLDY